MAPRVSPEIKKLAEVKSALHNESLGQYISRLIKEDCKGLNLDKILSPDIREEE